MRRLLAGILGTALAASSLGGTAQTAPHVVPDVAPPVVADVGAPVAVAAGADEGSAITVSDLDAAALSGSVPAGSVYLLVAPERVLDPMVVRAGRDGGGAQRDGVGGDGVGGDGADLLLVVRGAPDGGRVQEGVTAGGDVVVRLTAPAEGNSYTFTASTPLVGSLAVDGEPTTIDHTRPGQEVQLILRDVVPGERITVHTDPGHGHGHGAVDVVLPDGRTAQSWQVWGGELVARVLDPLPEGDVVLRFTAPARGHGPYTLTASTPVRGSLTVDGGALTIDPRPGQEVLLDLGTLAEGQVLDVRTTLPEGGFLEATLSIDDWGVHWWSAWEREVVESVTVPTAGEGRLRLVSRARAVPYSVEVRTG